MSRREKFVLKGGIQSDVILLTFTRTIRCPTLFIEGAVRNRDRFPLSLIK